MEDCTLLPKLLEAGMLICFGASWPCSLAKALRTKRVEGKSALFLWLVLIGYASGIASKVAGEMSWVTALYVFNAVVVSLDIAVYYRYSRRNAPEVAA